MTDVVRATPLDLAKGHGNYAAVSILERAEGAHQLIRTGEQLVPFETVTIRFGGPPGAGKSTLTNTLKVGRLWGYFRYESQIDEAADNVEQRTKGINCERFGDKDSGQFAILDLGGQGEFLASHHVFIGDGTVPVQGRRTVKKSGSAQVKTSWGSRGGCCRPP